MDLLGILMSSLWAGLFATGMAILLTVPRKYLFATFFCGLAGRLAQDLLIGRGMGQNWSTAVASAMVVLVAEAIIRRNHVSPVVLICGVLPLGAAVAMFNMIFELMKLSTAKGDEVNGVSNAFASNLAKVFVVSLSLAFGIGAGLAIMRLFRREEAVEVSM